MATASLLMLGRRAGLLLGLGVAIGLGCRAPRSLAARSVPGCRIHAERFVNEATHRLIPVRTYAPADGQLRGLKVALLNHGYGMRSKDYDFLARNLVAHGYLVVSLQQDLPGDAPLPTTGNPYDMRRPFWERGVQSMLVVLRELPRAHPELDCAHTLLVGHSYGGDMVMLFAQEHPDLVQKVISLDNCRMPLPRRRAPQLLSLRSSDQVADPGVLPLPAEQAALGMRIVQLPATHHGDMWDGGSTAQKQEINRYITEFLAE